MKKKSINPKIFLAAIPVILLAGAGAVFLSTRSPSDQDDSCAENVARLQEMENADISLIEQQLNALGGAGGSGGQTADLEEGAVLSDVEIKQVFQGTAIIGDSITESIWEYGYLDTDVVISKRGLSVAAADEQIDTAIALNPSTVFMAFGSNDLESYESNAQGFIDAYRTQVKKLQAALPDTPIYINGILPILQSTIDAVPALGYYPEYNQALQDFCTEMGCTYIDTSILVEGNDSIYEPDGEHVVAQYYPMWLTLMAKTAGL